jgi:hypothetical protein
MSREGTGGGAMPPHDPERARIAAAVRRELLKTGRGLYGNHCECLWQEGYNIVLNVKTGGVSWKS